MKDIRETETKEEIGVTGNTGWCMYIFLCIRDCLKSMGKGFRFDNENHGRRPREKSKG